MRRILHIIICVAIFTGCEKDLLNKVPVTTLSPYIFWESEQDAVAAANQLYAFLPSPADYISRDIMTDFAVGSNASNGLNDITEGTADSGTGEFQKWWAASYKAIAAANYFLENIDRVTAMKESDKTRLKAEARFIRSFVYFTLAMDFGDVPLITNSVAVAEASKVLRAPRFQVFNFILSELSEVSLDLPSRSTSLKLGLSQGRATSGAALALKARTAMFAGTLAKKFDNPGLSDNYFQLSLDASEQLINSKEYGLYPDFSKLFSYAAEYCNEIIISKNYAKDLMPYVFFLNYAPRELSGNSAMLMSVTRDLADMFEMAGTGKGITKAGSGWNPADPYLGRDPRFEATLYFSAYDNKSYCSITGAKRWDIRPNLPSNLKVRDVINKENGDNKTGFGPKKYINIEDQGQGGNDGTNFILFRYAEVLLLNAEARIELAQELNIAVERIDQVRTRVSMPVLANSGYSGADLANQSVMREVVQHERAVELALEGLRLYDIRRWKIAEKLFNGPVKGMTYLDYKTGKEVNAEWGVATRTFSPVRDYLFAVPSKERQINPNLTQNPGY